MDDDNDTKPLKTLHDHIEQVEWTRARIVYHRNLYVAGELAKHLDPEKVFADLQRQLDRDKIALADFILDHLTDYVKGEDT